MKVWREKPYCIEFNKRGDESGGAMISRGRGLRQTNFSHRQNVSGGVFSLSSFAAIRCEAHRDISEIPCSKN